MFAAVESDIVGYTQIEMQAGKWYQVGTPFIPLTDGAEQTLNNTFTTGFADGDQVYIYDSETNGYRGYYEWSTYNGQTGWFDVNMGILCTESLMPGQAVFIHKKTAGTVALPGRVSTATAAIFGNEAGNAWAQITCVFPAAGSVNDLTWTGVQDGDQLYIYDPETNGYRGYYEWSTYNGQTGWFDVNLGVLCSEQLNPGQAVFINKKSAGTATLLPGQAGTTK